MTRPKETVHTTHIILPPEKSVKLASPHFNPVIPQPPDYCVYLWATKSDPTPFYIGVGSEYQAYELIHRTETNGYMLHQTFRNIVGEDFLCIIAKRRIIMNEAYACLHYLYNKQIDPANPDILFTMREPTWLPTPSREYEVVQDFPTIPPQTIEQKQILFQRKSLLQQKLLVQRRNANLYKDYKKERTNILKIIPPTVDRE